jgi:hypothetical protein
MNAISEVSFNLTPVTEKPSRRYRKGSKYDPILDAFMSGMDTIVTVDVESKDANYLRMQLNKRIEASREEVNTKLDAPHPPVQHPRELSDERSPENAPPRSDSTKRGTHANKKPHPKQTRHGTLNPDDPRPTPFTPNNEKPETLMTSHHREKQT